MCSSVVSATLCSSEHNYRYIIIAKKTKTKFKIDSTRPKGIPEKCKTFVHMLNFIVQSGFWITFVEQPFRLERYMSCMCELLLKCLCILLIFPIVLMALGFASIRVQMLLLYTTSEPTLSSGLWRKLLSLHFLEISRDFNGRF